jgi:hypothetical protein
MKNYALSIILSLLFVASWAGQFHFGWKEYRAEQAEHGMVAEYDGYWPVFLRTTLENWESEFLQLASFVVLSALYIHKGSPQSKDGDERLERKVDAILDYLLLTDPEETDGTPRERRPPEPIDREILDRMDWGA